MFLDVELGREVVVLQLERLMSACLCATADEGLKLETIFDVELFVPRSYDHSANHFIPTIVCHHDFKPLRQKLNAICCGRCYQHFAIANITQNQHDAGHVPECKGHVHTRLQHADRRMTLFAMQDLV